MIEPAIAHEHVQAHHRLVGLGRSLSKIHPRFHCLLLHSLGSNSFCASGRFIECPIPSNVPVALRPSPMFLISDITASVAPEAMVTRALPSFCSSATGGAPARATILIGAGIAFASRPTVSMSMKPNG